MKRLFFIARISCALLVWFPLRSASAYAAAPPDSDQIICNRIFGFAFEHKLIEKPMGDVIAEIGKRFIGAPYAAGTLDSAGEERLVVNLRAFDCVTFVENVLALSRCVKNNTLTFDAYRAELEKIRYRDGKLNGYASRLHYFLDWINDNNKKGIVHNVTEEFGGKRQKKTINFMSGHRALYPHLVADSTLAAIREREKDLSGLEWHVIPISDVAKAKIANGDIIAITASVEGLDITHTGIAIKGKNGAIYLLHAPDPGQKIQATKETLMEHLKKHTKETGIVVTRANEPGGQ